MKKSEIWKHITMGSICKVLGQYEYPKTFWNKFLEKSNSMAKANWLTDYLKSIASGTLATMRAWQKWKPFYYLISIQILKK